MVRYEKAYFSLIIGGIAGSLVATFLLGAEINQKLLLGWLRRDIRAPISFKGIMSKNTPSLP